MPKLTVRTSGVVITTPLDGSPETIADTVQCVHCQRHWIYLPKSGTKWGYCLNCAGITCGNRRCGENCVPAEQWLENVEQGRPEGHRRIIVPAGGVIESAPTPTLPDW